MEDNAEPVHLTLAIQHGRHSKTWDEVRTIAASVSPPGTY